MFAADEPRKRRAVDFDAVGSDGNRTIDVDLHGATNAPDIAPPVARWLGSQHAALLTTSQAPCFIRSHLNLPMDLFLIVMEAEFVDVLIRRVHVSNRFQCKVRGETFLPELMLSFYFSFRLRRGGVFECYVIEVEGLPQVRESLRNVTKKETVVIHIQRLG